ncbi:MAG TPA: hypothetical protein V6D17_24655 [Candidatus Obscuribacterales bacterium]
MTVTTLTQPNLIRAGSHNSYHREIVTQSEGGSWVLAVPPALSSYQHELESLLESVFRGRRSTENLALAQQLSLNWCMSKCRQTGVSFEECVTWD